MEQTERNIFLRIVFSLLWLLPIMLVINIAVGAIVGGYAGSQTVTFQDGHAAGQQASVAFFQTYGRFVYIAELIIWLALCILGKLPGTSKFKNAKS